MKKLIFLLFGCGILPLKPIIPVQCDDLEAVCICDADSNCTWQWKCIQK